MSSVVILVSKSKRPRLEAACIVLYTVVPDSCLDSVVSFSLRDDIDNTAGSFGTIKYCTTTTDNFNFFNCVSGDIFKIIPPTLIDRYAINQNQSSLFHTSDNRFICHCSLGNISWSLGVHDDTGRKFQCFMNTGGAGFLNLISRQNLHCRRRFQIGSLHALCRHRHRIQFIHLLCRSAGPAGAGKSNPQSCILDFLIHTISPRFLT